jgi:hypothetical protein
LTSHNRCWPHTQPHPGLPQHRRPFERLLRKVLSLPNAPAVILLHAYAWFRPDPGPGAFYSNAERDFNEFAEYYGLPAVSVKSCCHAAMRANEPGFQVRLGLCVRAWVHWHVRARVKPQAGCLAVLLSPTP